MPTYIAVHQVKPHMSPEEAAKIVYATIKLLTKETQWLRYWISDDQGKMICLWSAPDCASVWNIVRSAGVPTSDVFEVEEGDPTFFLTGLDA
jgi:Nickel responsive protein SCO4226-like